MRPSNPATHAPALLLTVAAASLVAVTGVFWTGAALAARNGTRAGTPGVPYANMPAIAPIGVRVDKYLDVPDSAKGPSVDPVKGYRTQKLGDGLYMITDGAYQSMFMTYENGVVVVDAPPSYASHIPQAIAEVSNKPITHLVYSHAHTDHIGGAKSLGGRPIIIAQAETNRLLARDSDPNRPLATVTFEDRYRLSVGNQALELSYHGNAHLPGNTFIYAPKQRTLMVVDVIFPGWMPWRRFAVAQDIPAYFAQVKEINAMNFDTLVGGHVARTGTSTGTTRPSKASRGESDTSVLRISTSGRSPRNASRMRSTTRPTDGKSIAISSAKHSCGIKVPLTIGVDPRLVKATSRC